MSNRRGSPRAGNRFSQPFSSGNVNPWQGNALNQSGIISQLTSNPQLALALTSLLQPQQQQPPSLLSLNTSGYSDNRDFGRFGNVRGRDFRRHEPYTKGRGGWRTDRRGKKPQNDQNKKREPEKKPEVKKEEQEKVNEVVDFSMEESIDEESKESKRDWKDEKNQSEGKEDVEEEISVKSPLDLQGKEGKFVGVPAKYLNCFVCNKQMWDGESMGKHLKGRAHYEMLKAVEESIHICVDILRENMRLSEERKVIELNRQSRLRKYGDRKHFTEPNSHCNMCDLKFMGKIVTHRRSNDHQRLKRYLHPTCRICEKEFPSRVEWIEHRLTPEHLLKVHEISEKSAGGKDGDILMETKEIEAGDEDADAATAKAPSICEGDPSDVVLATSQNDPINEMEGLDLEPLLEEPLQMESDNAILELDEQLDGLQNRIPAYRRNRAVSTKSLQPFTGFVCTLCHRSFVDEQDGQDHLKTRKHYYKFIESLREQFERNERRAKKAEEALKQEANGNELLENSQENGEQGEQPEEADVSEVKQEVEDEEMYDPAVHTESNHEEDDINESNMDGENFETPILVEDDNEVPSATVTSTGSTAPAASTPVPEQSKPQPNAIKSATNLPTKPGPKSQNIAQKQSPKTQTNVPVATSTTSIPKQVSPLVSPRGPPGTAQQQMQRRSNVRNGAGPKSRRGGRRL